MTADLSDALVEQVQTANREGRRLRIRGAGSKPWMQGLEDELISVAGHAGIVSYESTELVVPARTVTTNSVDS